MSVTQFTEHGETSHEMATALAVNSIIDNDHNYTNISEKNDNKRKRDDIILEPNDINARPTNSTSTLSPEHKKPFFQRLYRPEHIGPYEVIIQDKDKKKIDNPFTIGKIIQLHHNDIDHITRSGKNLNVVCKTYVTANNLVNSCHLKNYNVFIPSNKVYCTGVIFIEQDVSESEILTDLTSNAKVILASRIKRRINNELKDTSFVKLTFDSDTLPEYVSLHYVRMKVDPYIIPVKQCYRCFSYGHVASSPCTRDRLCRDCGFAYHDNNCTNPKKCIHCMGPHSSNSKFCPEYIRQRNIKTRMSLQKEDYYKACIHFPITYKKQKVTTYRHQSYAETVKINDNESYPYLPCTPHQNHTSPTQSHYQQANIQTGNRFSAISNTDDTQDDQIVNSKTWLRNPNRPRPRPTHKLLDNKISNKSSYNQQTPKKPSYINTPEQATSASKTTHDREDLETKIQNKLSKVRELEQYKKSSTSTIFDQLLSSCIETNFKKPTTTIKKSQSITNINNKNGTKRT